MTYRLIKNDSGIFTLASDAGNLARTTASEIFITKDHVWAEEALDYLNQSAVWPAKPKGSHRAKSTFGTILLIGAK